MTISPAFLIPAGGQGSLEGVTWAPTAQTDLADEGMGIRVSYYPMYQSYPVLFSVGICCALAPAT